MKKINLLLVMLALCCLSVNATVILVAEGGDEDKNIIETAIDNAAAGDTIELTTSGGSYPQREFTVGIDITVRAAEGLADKPVITAESDSKAIFKIADSFTLVLEGLELTGGKYAVRCTSQDSTTLTSVKVNDCYAHDFAERFLMIDAQGKEEGEIPLASGIDSVIIRNSIFSDITKEAIVFYSGTGNDAGIPMEYAEVSNCTFNNIGREAIKSQTSEVKKVLVNQCTFYNCGTSGKSALYFKDIVDAEITNCIFMANTYSSYWMNVTDETLVSNVILYDVANTKINGGDENYVSDTLKIDPLFTDGVNADFTLQLSSPALTYGDQGQAIGDTRWVVDPTGFTFSPKVLTFEAGAVTNSSVMFLSDDAWTIEVETSAASWLSVDKTSGGVIEDPEYLAITANANPDFVERSGKVYGLFGGIKKDSVIITQAGLVALEIVAQDDMQFSGSGGTKTLTFSAGLDWEVLSDDPSWISFLPPNGAASNEQVIDIIVNPNTGGYRTATVSILAGSGAYREDIAISQLRAPLTPAWTVYDCSVLPSAFTTPFVLDDTPLVEEVVDNDILKFCVSKEGKDVYERFDFEEDTDFDTYDGFTLMAKIKGLDSSRVIEFELKGGEYREKLKIEDDRINADKGKSLSENSQYLEYPENIDIMNDYVVFRMAYQRGATQVWINEQYLGTYISTTTDGKGELFGFGDSSDGESYGVNIDWLMWDLTGAYGPSEGAALPSDVQTPTSIDMNSKQEAISIYPNPSNGSFIVANKAGANLEIITLNGQVVFAKSNISANEQVTLDLQSGIYVVKVNDTIGKLVVK